MSSPVTPLPLRTRTLASAQVTPQTSTYASEMSRSRISFPTVSKLIAKFTPPSPPTPVTPKSSRFLKNKYGSLKKSDGSLRILGEDGTEEILELSGPQREERERDLGELNRWADSLLSNLENSLDNMTSSLKVTMDDTSVRMSAIEQSLSELLKWSDFDAPISFISPPVEVRSSYSRSSDDQEYDPSQMNDENEIKDDEDGSEYSVW